MVELNSIPPTPTITKPAGIHVARMPICQRANEEHFQRLPRVYGVLGTKAKGQSSGFDTMSEGGEDKRPQAAVALTEQNT